MPSAPASIARRAERRARCGTAHLSLGRLCWNRSHPHIRFGPGIESGVTAQSGYFLWHRQDGSQMATPYDEMPWLRFYPTGVPPNVDVPDVPLTQLLDDSAARFPRRAALAFFGRGMSYRQVVRQADRFAGALRRFGVHKGDRVALILPNCPQQIIAFYGTLRRGAVVVMHNPLYTAAELHHQLADSGARVVVVFDRIHETVAEALPGTHVEHVIVTSLIEYLPRMKRLLLRLPLQRARE